MILKASNVTNIDDFIDCAIFNVDYISFDMSILLKQGKKFGNCISCVPLVKNNLVLNINSDNEAEIDKTLAMCNINVLQFNNEVSFSLLKKYKKNYIIWKYVDNEKDAEKYADYVNSFVIPHEQLNALLECKAISGHQLIVRATQKKHVEDIENIASRNLVIDVEYDGKMSDVIRNKRLVVKRSS